MSSPTDGYGVYEEADPTGQGPNYYQSRLTQIAAAGFKLVLNYWLLQGHATDITAYINYAHSVGLKVIVSLKDPAIWLNNTIATTYPLLYADSGNLSTDSAFSAYVVNLVKGLAGTWGYYVGDEVDPTNHAALVTHAGYITATDSVKPSLYIDTVFTGSTQSIALDNSIFSDVSSVAGTDIYPIGRPGDDPTLTATRATNIQTFCTTNSLQSAIVLQAQSWRVYQQSWTSATWPTQAQMQSQRDQAVTNMTPRVILWYSYFDDMRSDNPAQHFNDLVLATFAPPPLPGGYVAPTEFSGLSVHH